MDERPSLPGAPPLPADESSSPARRGTWLSAAGRWAMRPQTAMATVFFVMIGSSALLLGGKGRHSPNASVVVTQQGAPLAASPQETDGAVEAVGAARGNSLRDEVSREADVRAATSAFAAGRYDEAKARFDALSSHDPRGVLGAARVQRQLQGCTAAIAGFVQAESAGRGSLVEWDARLEAATCFRKLGDREAATRELTPLLAVSTHRERARLELESLNAQPKSRGGGQAH